MLHNFITFVYGLVYTYGDLITMLVISACVTLVLSDFVRSRYNARHR